MDPDSNPAGDTPDHPLVLLLYELMRRGSVLPQTMFLVALQVHEGLIVPESKQLLIEARQVAGLASS